MWVGSARLLWYVCVAIRTRPSPAPCWTVTPSSTRPRGASCCGPHKGYDDEPIPVLANERWASLLTCQPVWQDPEPHDFAPRHEFVFCLVTHTDHVPPETADRMVPIRVAEAQKVGSGGGQGVWAGW